MTSDDDHSAWSNDGQPAGNDREGYAVKNARAFLRLLRKRGQS